MADGDTLMDDIKDLDNPDAIDGDVDGHVVKDDPVDDKDVKADKDHNDKPDDKANADGDKADDKDKPAGAPDEYEAFESLKDSDIDGDAVQALAKELNLDQAQAEKFVNRFVESAEEAAEARLQLWTDQNQEWQKAARADKEFGGLKFEENLGKAKSVIQRFGTTELLEVVDSYGMGNHPEFIRLLVRMGNAISEDAMVTGGAQKAPQSPADVLYPNQGK